MTILHADWSQSLIPHQICNYWNTFHSDLVCSRFNGNITVCSITWFLPRNKVFIAHQYKLFDASHHLFKTLETFIIHASPVCTSLSDQIWNKEQQTCSIELLPLYSILICWHYCFFFSVLDDRRKHFKSKSNRTSAIVGSTCYHGDDLVFTVLLMQDARTIQTKGKRKGNRNDVAWWMVK